MEAPVRERTGFDKFVYGVHMTLTEPSFSPLAAFISNFILMVILVSTLVFVLGSMNQYAEVQWLETLEVVAVMIFSIEYLVRFVVHQGSRVEFMTDTMNLVDVFAVLPWYVEEFLMANPQLGLEPESLAPLRVMRILRLMKLLKKNEGMQMFAITMIRSGESFKLLLLFMSLAVLIYSSLFWYAERGIYDEAKEAFLRSDGEESPFTSIPATFWWAIVTMTTVGYGDTYPIETMGKVVATITMLSGVLVLALPLSIIGTNFSVVYEEFQIRKEAAAVKKDNAVKTGADVLREIAFEVDEAKRALEKAYRNASLLYESVPDSAGCALVKEQIDSNRGSVTLQLTQFSAQLKSTAFKTVAESSRVGA